MDSFDWRDGERTIHFGRGRFEHAVDLVGGPGFTLLTTERAQSDAAGLATAAEAVHLVPGGFVDEIAGELLGEVRGDRLVAFGGGRVIDVAKALAAGLRHGGGSANAMAVPTTLSGAEMTWVHRHAAGVPAEAARARPTVVVCDPAVAASQPVEELAASALNALGHAAEAPLTTQRNPVATLAALEAARLIAIGFGDADTVRDGDAHRFGAADRAAGGGARTPGGGRGATGGRAAAGDGATGGNPDRDALALAALLAGYAIDSAWYGLHHVMSQTAVRLCQIGHGPANAILLPHTMRALAQRNPAAFEQLGIALGGHPSTVASRICVLTGATHLSQLGVTPDQLDACADAAAGRAELELTPPKAGRDELRAIYGAAL
jgi:alcohol dehydrogenase class IV